MPQYRPMVYRALPVSSESEMNAITVDFNGMPTYFHNQQTNEIYVKQFDIKTGLTTIQKFIKSDGTEKPSGDENPSIDMSLYDEKLNAITDRLTALEEKGGKK